MTSLENLQTILMVYRNILYSLVVMMVITTVTYFLLNLTFLTALTKEEMSNAPTVISVSVVTF